MKRNLSIFLALIIILSGCASKKFFKQAEKYEASGAYRLAVENYSRALSKKDDYTEARIGLMRAMTLYSSELHQSIDLFFVLHDDDAVVENYTILLDLKSLADRYTIPFTIEGKATGEFRDAKYRYLENYYRQALLLQNQQKFSQALSLYNKVLAVDNDYAKAKENRHYCICQPLYLEANRYYENREYRNAYITFNKVIKEDKDFRDAQYMRNQSYYRGCMVMAFTNFANESRYPTFIKNIKRSTGRLLAKERDSFFKFDDLYSNKRALEALKVAMQSDVTVDPTTVLPVNVVVEGRVLSLKNYSSKLTKEKRKGFLKFTNKDKVVTYKKIYYYEYSQYRTISASMVFNAYNRVGGESLGSSTVTRTMRDAINYIYYDGKNESKICDGDWMYEFTKFNPEHDIVNTSRLKANELSSKARARRTLKGQSTMEEELSDMMAHELAKKLFALRPKK